MTSQTTILYCFTQGLYRKLGFFPPPTIKLFRCIEECTFLPQTLWIPLDSHFTLILHNIYPDSVGQALLTPQHVKILRKTKEMHGFCNLSKPSTRGWCLLRQPNHTRISGKPTPTGMHHLVSDPITSRCRTDAPGLRSQQLTVKPTPWRNFMGSLMSCSVLTSDLLLNFYHLAGFPKRKLV